jgi:hypothetical protein
MEAFRSEKAALGKMLDHYLKTGVHVESWRTYNLLKPIPMAKTSH